MALPYNIFTGAFLAKVTSYDLANMEEDMATDIIDGYMKAAIAAFKHVCKYDLSSTAIDVEREFDIEIADEDLDELVEIIATGMVVQWLKPFVNRQENLENVLNTRDFTTYSPAELLNRVGGAYSSARSEFINYIREYSYTHGDLTVLHL